MLNYQGVSKKNIWGRLALCLGMSFLAFFVLIPEVQAQETGQIAGRITDPTGAAVPNVKITVRNMGTNAVRLVTTNDTGNYVITGLTPAMYQFTAAATSGFNAYQSTVEVTVAGRLTMDVQLQVGATTATVEVSATEGGAQVNTQTQELSQIVNATQIAQMPSLTRNPYDLVALSGNVSSGDSTN